MSLKELEKELELQIGMKTEMEIAMKLLEKDTHEKQDTLVALRQQLEEVKAINLQMFHKVQVRTGLRSGPLPSAAFQHHLPSCGTRRQAWSSALVLLQCLGVFCLRQGLSM